MASKALEILRGATSVLLFAVFGLGALAISPLMLVLRKPELCQRIVRAVWRPLVKLFIWTGLIAVERGNLPNAQGTILVANHPSLIDVVIVVSLVPKTLYIAKHGLRTNPVMAAIVRATSLPDDARLFDAAAPYLKKGWNVLIFPEGTRSPEAGGLHPFKRGAAQLALRTGAPVVCVGIRQSRQILAKRQAIWDMGPRRVTYAFRADAPTVEIPLNARDKNVASPLDGESLHAAARRVTDELSRRIGGLLA